MKTFTSAFAALFVMTAVLMVSCDTEETSTSLSINLLKKAQIKGYVYAQLDLTNAGLEKAPAGTQVIISIPYSQLNSLASGTYKDTAVVNAEGFFQAEVPVGNNGASITFIPVPFETNQTQVLNSFESQIMKYYTSPNSSIFLGASSLEIVEIQYIANDYADYVQISQISGVLMAVTNDTATVTETGQAGIELTFYGNGWNKSVTTTDGGAYSIEVPSFETIYVDYSFTAFHIVWDAAHSTYLPILYLYEDPSRAVGSFGGVITVDVDIHTGYGDVVE